MSNGYAEITIKESKVGLKFGMYSLRLIQEKSSESKILTKDSALTEVGMSYVPYAGYLNWCVIKEIVPVFAFQDFYDYVEGVLYGGDQAEELLTVIDVFSNSKVIKGIEPKDEKKKKQTLKK